LETAARSSAHLGGRDYLGPMKSGDRRRLLLLGAGAALAAIRGAPARAVWAAPPVRSALQRRPRELWITRPEAQESVRATYWADGAVQADGYRSINRIYRDLQAGIERPIALALLDLNFVMQCVVAQSWSARPLVLLSGFRTVQTNRQVGGVEPSLHFEGRADDYIYAGLSFQDNLRLARLFQIGGLGIYPDRGSLHKDLGRSRVWVEYGRRTAAHDQVMAPTIDLSRSH
jgi:uncharacterized protein YcbK (DUF882 family)